MCKRCVCVRERECVCERERESVCVCVCVWWEREERERSLCVCGVCEEREREWSVVCVWERGQCVCVCVERGEVCVCGVERESVCVCCVEERCVCVVCGVSREECVCVCVCVVREERSEREWARGAVENVCVCRGCVWERERRGREWCVLWVLWCVVCERERVCVCVWERESEREERERPRLTSGGTRDAHRKLIVWTALRTSACLDLTDRINVLKQRCGRDLWPRAPGVIVRSSCSLEMNQPLMTRDLRPQKATDVQRLSKEKARLIPAKRFLPPAGKY